MNAARFIRRSLAYHWRTQATVLAGTALCTAVIVGALLVGDSVRASLRAMAGQRLGRIEHAVVARRVLFRAALADPLAAAPALLMPGTAADDAGRHHAGNVQIVGIDDRFRRLAPSGAMPDPGAGVILNQTLAAQLAAAVGDEVLLRIAPPGSLSTELALAPDGDAIAFRLPVTAVVGPADFGHFSLAASQLIPATAFVPLAFLQERAEQPDRANLLLSDKPLPPLTRHWQPEDAGIYQVGDQLRHRHVFIPPPVLAALRRAAPAGRPMLTYFVNTLTSRGRECPYSMVGAVAGDDLEPGQVRINQWLADDLGAAVGDPLELRYFAPDPGRQLREAEAAFTIVAIEPTRPRPELMPDFPGLSDPDNCRDWDPGIPIALGRIRDRDEAYWDAYRGTPKAMLNLDDAQRLWRNRFGEATAFLAPDFLADPDWPARLLDGLTPEDVGLLEIPVREQAWRAASQGTDFGMLFVSLSFFLVAAALALTGLLFALGVQQREPETGILLALGLTPRRVRGFYLIEGLLVAVAGALLGLPLGAAYTAAMIAGLRGVWGVAVSQSPIVFHAAPATLLVGLLAGVVVALAAIFAALAGRGRRPVRELLTGVPTEAARFGSGRRHWWPAVTLTVAALALTGLMLVVRELQNAGVFFAAGALLLAAALAALWAFLRRPGRPLAAAPRLAVLAGRNLARHPARALSTAGALACGAFLVVAVGAFRQDARIQADDPRSGTGGFAFYAESALPITRDLNDPEARDHYGLDERLFTEVRFVPLRRRDGDDASCLNLNRAQQPVVLGVDPARLDGRFRFLAGASSWTVLDGDGIPAVTDRNTITYALGQRPGGLIHYPTDSGPMVEITLAAGLANSILQGRLIIHNDHFERLFPGEPGWRVFLIDCPPEQREAVAAALTRTLAREGLDVTPAVERLGAFLAVENTYIGIFQVLGGLGLILGSIGLAVVLLRHALERRRELALLRALGFSKGRLARLLMAEHWLLLVLGVAGGAVAGLVAVLPLLRVHGATPPWLLLGLTLAGILLAGFLGVAVAARAALRAPLLDALRHE